MTKGLRSLKKIISACFIAICVLTFQSCGDTSKPEDTKEMASDSNDEKFDDTKDMGADFLVNAAEINLEEIQLGQLAQANGTTQDTKDLGKMMEAEHSKAMKDLEALAAKKAITIPTTLTEKGQDAYKKLSEKKGVDFDKEYADMMVKGHKDAIDKFEKAAGNVKDTEISAWASSMLPSLKTHLSHSEMCEEKLKKM